MQVRFLFVGLLALLAAALLPVDAQAQTKSPFGVQVETRQPSAATNSGVVSRLLAQVYARQQAFHRLLTDAVKAFRTDPAAIWLLLGASFFYGVFHAAGPGHGKAVLSSYMIANETQIRRGIALAFAAAFVQALSAIALVAVLAMILNATSIVIKSTTNILETASYAMIALVGFWLLVTKTRRLLRGRAAKQNHAHHHHHDHAHAHGETCADCGHSHMPSPEQLSAPLSLREAASLVFAMGLRPCTGAILVLLFALAQGILLAGIGATFAMAFGTALTVSALAVLALGAKHLALRFAGSSGQGALVHNGIELAAAAFILGLGVLLFAATLAGGGSPF